MNNLPQHTRPAWAMISAWLIGVAIAALLGIALVQGESWTERQVLRYAAVFLAVFGVGFLLSSHSPQHPMLFRYLVRVAQRGRRWFRLSGLITGGEPRAAGWLCLVLAAIVAVVSLVLP